MRYRKLGHTDMEASVIAFGAWQIGDPNFWGADSAAEAERTVAAAMDAGINFFDTAEMYGAGHSEEVLGNALHGKRDQVLIADKISPDHCTAEGVRLACENSLKRLKTDYIDLYQLHWAFPRERFPEVWNELHTLKKDGKIRECGVSNFGPQDLAAWMDVGSAVSNQLGYNLLFRAPEYEMIPVTRHYGLGILIYMPLMQGLLTGRYIAIDDIPMPRRRTRHFSAHRDGTRHGQPGHEEALMDTVQDLYDFAEAIGIPMAVLCLAWLIAQPGISSVILGARKVEQMLANLPAADLDIGPAAIAQLNEFSFPLKVALGPNCDMWESEENSRIR